MLELGRRWKESYIDTCYYAEEIGKSICRKLSPLISLEYRVGDVDCGCECFSFYSKEHQVPGSALESVEANQKFHKDRFSLETLIEESLGMKGDDRPPVIVTSNVHPPIEEKKDYIFLLGGE